MDHSERVQTAHVDLDRREMRRRDLRETGTGQRQPGESYASGKEAAAGKGRHDLSSEAALRLSLYHPA
jgi:hypothetical protein